MKTLLTMVFAGCIAVSMTGAYAADDMMKKDEMKKDAPAPKAPAKAEAKAEAKADMPKDEPKKAKRAAKAEKN